MMADAFVSHLVAAGFKARAWQNKRIYLDGYGRDIKAYLAMTDINGSTLDHVPLIVTTSWRSSNALLRRKGIKHQLLNDLYRAGFLLTPPPSDWRTVRLDADVRPRPTFRPSASDEHEAMFWPFF